MLIVFRLFVDCMLGTCKYKYIYIYIVLSKTYDYCYVHCKYITITISTVVFNLENLMKRIHTFNYRSGSTVPSNFSKTK